VIIKILILHYAHVTVQKFLHHQTTVQHFFYHCTVNFTDYQLHNTNKCKYLWSLYSLIFTITTQLKHLNHSYMFRSIDHHQGAHIVPVLDQFLDNNLMHGISSIVNCGLRFSYWCCLCLTLKLETAGSSNMVVATCMMTCSHGLVYCILYNQTVCSFLFQNL
jgi:hypothetical protein